MSREPSAGSACAIRRQRNCAHVTVTIGRSRLHVTSSHATYIDPRNEQASLPRICTALLVGLIATGSLVGSSPVWRNLFVKHIRQNSAYRRGQRPSAVQKTELDLAKSSICDTHALKKQTGVRQGLPAHAGQWNRHPLNCAAKALLALDGNRVQNIHAARSGGDKRPRTIRKSALGHPLV